MPGQRVSRQIRREARERAARIVQAKSYEFHCGPLTYMLGIDQEAAAAFEAKALKSMRRHADVVVF